MIHKAGVTGVGRVIVAKMKLWLPKLPFNRLGEQKYLRDYLKTYVWNYLKENVFISPSI